MVFIYYIIRCYAPRSLSLLPPHCPINSFARSYFIDIKAEHSLATLSLLYVSGHHREKMFRLKIFLALQNVTFTGVARSVAIRAAAAHRADYRNDALVDVA